MLTDAQLLASNDDTYVARDKAANSWTIASDAIALEVGFDRVGDYRLVSLSEPLTGRSWDIGAGPDTCLTVGDSRLPLGSRSAGFSFVEPEAAVTPAGVRLALKFSLRRPELLVTRCYQVVSHVPVIETWTTVQVPAGADPASFSDFNALDIAAPAGALRWLTGLQVGQEDGGPFTLHRRDLGPGEVVQFGAQHRSLETYVPWLGVEEPDGRFFSGLMWSGAWTAVAARGEGEIRLRMGLSGTFTDLPEGVALEMPHGFFGAAAGGDANMSARLRDFIVRGVRGGRPFEPSVVYNTWFVYGTWIDDALIRREIEANAALGTETFVLDAGWQTHSGAEGKYDFTSALGSWNVDQDRFPDGLAALADYARANGMRFGIWVEPERTSLGLLEESGIPEEWLATSDGRYDPAVENGESRVAQICLADPRARQWVFDRVVQLIEEVRPDYLKWDNNHWVSCSRAGHGHGPLDGNFRQVEGLYSILAALRERFPALIIENVSGGGTRLDFGLLRYTDVGWMDDRTAPSAHVRHNLEGLSSLFPPAYLFSFLMNTEEEPLHQEVARLARSRMPGVFGLSFCTDDLEGDDQEGLAREIAIYKSLRDLLGGASATLLTPQVSEARAGDWDAIQMRSEDSGQSVIYAYAGSEAPESIIVRPVQLREAVRYEVSSADGGVLGYARGSDLMLDGIEIVGAPLTAHIFVLRPESIEVSGRRRP